MSITVHQALHGYSEGHRQLACSATLSSKDARLMLVMSDVSGPGVTAVGSSYLTGYPLADSGLYALSMTWPAPEMPRPGCVWTHTLLIAFADLAVMDMPSALAQLFSRPSDERFDVFKSEVNIDVETVLYQPINPAEIRYFGILSGALYGHPYDQIWARRISDIDIDSVVLRLWDQQWPRLRRSFKFCTLTTRDRSQDVLKFDLQVTAGGNSAQLRFASNSEGVEAIEIPQDDWLSDLIYDAAHPIASSLRQMLRVLGADLLGGREAMSPICRLHSALANFSSNTLSLAVSMVQNDAILSTSKIAKAIVARAALTSKLRIESDRQLQFILQHFDLFGDVEAGKQAENLAALVWRANPRMFIVSSYEGGEKVRVALRNSVSLIDRDQIFAALPMVADLAGPLLELFPELILDRRFWEYTQFWPTHIALPDVELSAPQALRAMIEGLRDEGAIRSALRVVSTPRVLACIDELIRLNLPVADLAGWIRQACADLQGVASFLSHNRQSLQLLLHLATAIPPDAVPNDYGDDPWAVALSNLYATEGGISVELSVYGFRRALSRRSRSVETLLCLTFEPLHAAATQQAIPPKSWGLLEGVLPWASPYDAWDSGLRLRRATAKLCVELPVRPEGFLKLAADDQLFIQLMESVWHLWNGSRYLRNVRDSVIDRNRRLSRKQGLVTQFIEERSSFWS